MQGGTFLNDAVLRAFENELGVDVVRPDIAGLMGAYGAALHAMAQRALHAGESTVLSLDALNTFTHSVKQARCGLCENHCRLTVNDFGGGRRFISGNRCDRPVSGGRQQSGLNLYAYKQGSCWRSSTTAGRTRRAAQSACRWGSTCMSFCPSGTRCLRIWALT